MLWFRWFQAAPLYSVEFRSPGWCLIDQRSYVCTVVRGLTTTYSVRLRLEALRTTIYGSWSMSDRAVDGRSYGCTVVFGSGISNHNIWYGANRRTLDNGKRFRVEFWHGCCNVLISPQGTERTSNEHKTQGK